MAKLTLEELKKKSLKKYLHEFNYDVTAYKEDKSIVDILYLTTNVICSNEKIILSTPIPETKNILAKYLQEASLIKKIRYDLLDDQGESVTTLTYSVNGFSNWSIENQMNSKTFYGYAKDWEGYKTCQKTTEASEELEINEEEQKVKKANYKEYKFHGYQEHEQLLLNLEFIGVGSVAFSHIM